MDIVEFLTARLDEDQDIAIAAARGASFTTTYGDGAPNWTVELASTIRSDPKGWRFVEVRGLGAPATHIAHWDPARVLAELAAKRRVLARHHAAPKSNYRFRPTDPTTYVCLGCGYTGDCDDPVTDDINECPELRDLASIWSDHPDYDPAWQHLGPA